MAQSAHLIQFWVLISEHSFRCGVWMWTWRLLSKTLNFLPVNKHQVDWIL